MVFDYIIIAMEAGLQANGDNNEANLKVIIAAERAAELLNWLRGLTKPSFVTM